jgi:TonB-dependent receptor
MRFSALVRCSASLGALALSTSPAWAQTVPAEQPTTAQESPADGTELEQEADAAEASGEGEDIVVTGIRESLRSAQNIRRNSDQIVDAIIAEDIGKLPDIAVSDTAARIPGVQVIRQGGEASRVLIRGLPDFATLYNGREIFTAETRLVSLGDFPSANIAALEVFKTTTANLVEAGLAGLVNVRSRRPFDFSEGQVAGSVWGLYTYQADKITPNANFLITDRWETAAGDIGVLLNASYTELQYLDSEPSNTDFLQTFRREGNRLICCGPPVDARFPDIQRNFYRSGNRVRPSVNASFQWRPDDQFEFYAEFLWQGFRNKIDDRLLAVPLYNGGAYSNLVFRPGTNLLESGTVTGLADPILTVQGGTLNRTDTFQYAVGGIFERGPLRMSVDIARTNSTFTGSTESIDRTFGGQATTTVDFDFTTPQFNIRNFDPTNINNYFFDGVYEEQQESSGNDWQARFDARYQMPEGFFIQSAEAGFRYSSRDAHREFGNRFFQFRGRGIPASSLPLVNELSPPGYRGTDIQPFRSFLTPTYGSIRENRVALRQFVISQGPPNRPPSFGTFTLDAPAPDPNQTYDATEETLAGYGQVNYNFNDIVDGVIGIRVVHTDTQVTGTANIAGVATPINVGPSFTDYLPNASLRWRIMPGLQLRLSATQTRTRPTFAELNPSFSLGAPDPNQGNRRFGSGGNPNLRPFTSDNYDAALEYYFSRNGFASVSVFRRDLVGFIERQNVDLVDPILGPIRINQPVNSGQGRIEGAEAQFQTFFDFAGVPQWAHGFGVQANVTYLTAETGFPNGTGGFNLQPLVGVSEWTYNIVGIYEGGGLSARLSYNNRGNFIGQRDNRGDDIYIQEVFPAPRLDLSLNYNLLENATIFFDWTNILQDPHRENFSSARGAGTPRAEYVRFLRFDETTVSLGIRFRL